MNELLQIFANSFVAGCSYGLVAIGFSLIFTTGRFFNFAYGAIYMAGAYLTYTAVGIMGLPAAVVLGAAGAGLLGGVTELTTYQPLRKRQAPPLTLLIASLGIYLILQNSISLIFGDETKLLRSGVVEAGSLLGIRLSSIQYLIILVSIVIFATTWWLLSRTRIGKIIRAISSNPDLALIVGVRRKFIIVLVMVLGSSIAGVSGILMGLDTDLIPTMGFRPLMMGIIAVIIGGVNSIPGIALGALLLGIAQNFGAWFIGSQWQDAIAFIILVLFLLFKPEGFFGKKVKSATI